MNKRSSKVLTIFLIVPICALMSSRTASAGMYTNQADIKVVNAPTSDGTIVFLFQPKGGTEQHIHVEVDEGWGAQGVAREIQRTFNNEVGTNCKVSWNNKRRVTITRRNNTTRFRVRVYSQSAAGVTIRIDYD